jgi:Outer membrane protein beta-barrel domain
MRSISRKVSILAAMAALGAVLPACWAQDPEGSARNWEVGALGGGSFYNTGSVSGSGASGDVGIKPGAALGAFVGSDLNKRFGGELRYEFLPGDLKVSSNGNEATFTGRSQAIHYDLLVHFKSTRSKIQPYISAGGGVKVYQGTGSATATQTLSNLALLTNTHETKGLGVAGAGIKARVSKRVSLRFEVKDFITPFPRQVIAPAPGAKISGILNDFVVLAGIGFTF